MPTPFMNLTLPIVTITLGPQWATELNDALEAVDEHDHTSGKGKLITTAALDIDADLDLNGFRLVDTNSVRLNSLGSPVSGIGFENSLSNDTGDLYWTNNAGVPVQITAGGSIVSSPSALEVIQYDVTAVDLIIGSGSPMVFISVNATAPRTITLPLASAVPSGRIYVIKDALGASETFNITVAASGADLIDQSSTYTINSNNQALVLASNGVNGYKSW